MIAPAHAARSALLDRRLAADAMKLVTVVHPGSLVVQARLLPVALAADHPLPFSTAMASLDAGGRHPLTMQEGVFLRGRSRRRKLETGTAIWALGLQS